MVDLLPVGFSVFPLSRTPTETLDAFLPSTLALSHNSSLCESRINQRKATQHNRSSTGQRVNTWSKSCRVGLGCRWQNCGRHSSMLVSRMYCGQAAGQGGRGTPSARPPPHKQQWQVLVGYTVYNHQTDLVKACPVPTVFLWTQRPDQEGIHCQRQKLSESKFTATHEHVQPLHRVGAGSKGLSAQLREGQDPNPIQEWEGGSACLQEPANKVHVHGFL